MINEENFLYSAYKNQNMRAMIGIGAEPTNIDQLLYFVTVLEDDHTEIAQKSFQELSSALYYINSKYSEIWDFNDPQRPAKPSGGCSTCVAH